MERGKKAGDRKRGLSLERRWDKEWSGEQHLGIHLGIFVFELRQDLQAGSWGEHCQNSLLFEVVVIKT